MTAVVLILLRISDKSCGCGTYHQYVVSSRPVLYIRKKGRTRLAAGSDKVYKFLSYGWFSPGTPSSTNKTGRHDIAEILLKVPLNTINQSINVCVCKITPYA